MANWTDHSLLFATQADITTVTTAGKSDHVALLCDTPSVSFDTEITELELLTGAVGAAPERLAGRRSGSITFNVPLQGLKDGYDPDAEQPGGAPDSGAEVIPPILALIGNAIGSAMGSLAGANDTAKTANFFRGANSIYSGVPYGSGKVASSSGLSNIVVDDAGMSGDITPGEFVVTATADTVTNAMTGFVKTKALEVLTLFEDAVNQVTDAGAHVYGTATVWQSDAEPVPLTIRWCGQATEFEYILSGCICESWSISLNAGEVPQVAMTYRFYNYSMNKTEGGLVVPDDYERTPQIVGDQNAQATLDTDATCGLEDVSIAWSATIREIMCHHAEQGVSSATVIKPRIKVSMSVPHDDGDAIYNSAGVAGNTGQHIWQSRLELGSTTSLGIYVGATPGRCFGILVPAAYIVAAPGVDVGDIVRYSLELEATAYTGDDDDDGASTGVTPLDSLFRLGMG